MILQDSLLVTLVRLIDRLPLPAHPAKRGRGRGIGVFRSHHLKGVSDYDRASLAKRP